MFVSLAPAVPFVVVATSIWWASRGRPGTAVLLAENVNLYAVLVALWEPIISGLAALGTLLMLNPRLKGGRGAYFILVGAALLAAPVTLLPAALAAFLCAWVVRNMHRATPRRIVVLLALSAVFLLLTVAMLIGPQAFFAPLAAAPFAGLAYVLWRARGHPLLGKRLRIALLRTSLTVVAICAALAPVVVRLDSSQAPWLHYEGVTLQAEPDGPFTSARGAMVSVDDTGMLLLLPDGDIAFIDSDSIAWRTVEQNDPDDGYESLATLIARLPLGSNSASLGRRNCPPRQSRRLRATSRPRPSAS